MISIVDLHPAVTTIAAVVIPVKIQITMKAVCFPASTGHLLRGPIIYKISKIIGEK